MGVSYILLEIYTESFLQEMVEFRGNETVI
jgi:hypothetical protein